MADPWLPREEYIALHNEMRGRTAELARLECACVLGVAAIFAWLANGAGDYVGYQGLVWLVPIIVPVYGSLKAWAVCTRLAHLRDYLKKLESAALPGEERWQTYLGRVRPGTRGAVTFLAWVLLLVFTVAGSTLGFMDFREQCPGPLHNACLEDAGAEEQATGT